MSEPQRSIVVPALAGCGCGAVTAVAAFFLVPVVVTLGSWALWESGMRVMDGGTSIAAGSVLGVVVAAVAGLVAAVVGALIGRRLS